MTLKTKRLTLIPLSPEQLFLWINDLPALERLLDCRYRATPLEGIFREIVAGQLAIAARDPDHHLWHSFWFIVRQSDRVVVGSADFKGVPDENGAVEIGYGLGDEFTHNGYMTETVAAMCAWAFLQTGVREILAETDLDGDASQRLLRACGFQELKRAETIWFHLQK